jgi:hypothetical protein
MCTIVGYSAACDFTLALLPWKILMGFHMYRREKIGVAIAMSMGILYVPISVFHF